MGVPTFYRWLCNRYPRVPKDVVDNYNDRYLDTSDDEMVGIELLSPNPNGEFDNLYLDMNGIIHPCCHPENIEQPSSEEVMYQCIFDYIDRVFFLVRPRKLIFLAIDGVAPRAKMNQQRSRRFKSAADADLEDETYEKVLEGFRKRNIDVPARKKKWDSNVITPGTPFMHELSKRIVKYIRERIEKYDAWKRITVIFSDANVPGEGEHKIMNFIRNQRHSANYNPNMTHVLHGMDADLIMLGLATHEVNFFIIREIVTNFIDFKPEKEAEKNIVSSVNMVGNKKSGDNYLSIMRGSWKPLQFLQLPVLREYLSHQLYFPNDWSNGVGGRIDFERCIDDLVLMCFFCGNDFLPNLPSISIAGGSIDQMILLYQRVLPELGDYLSNEGELNMSQLGTFVSYLGKIEDQIFKQALEHKERFKRKHQEENKVEPSEPEEIAKKRKGDGSYSHSVNPSLYLTGVPVNKLVRETVEKSDLIPTNLIEGNEENKTILDPSSIGEEFKKRQEELLNEYRVIDDPKYPIDLSLNDPALWKASYYREKFNIEADTSSFVAEVSEHYVRGLLWILKYYYQGCISWGWFYPYHYAPFCSDLSFESLELKFDLGKPFTPIQQLMSVMPIRSSHCIPKECRELMTDPNSPIVDFYPLKFREDPNGKRYKYQWVALLPFIDEQRLLKVLAPIEENLKKEDQERNSTSKDLLFINNKAALEDLIGHVEGDGDPKFFTSKCSKKHKSRLLQGALIPTPKLRIEDIMEDQRNRGFNCDVAKRIILNLLNERRNDVDRNAQNRDFNSGYIATDNRDYYQNRSHRDFHQFQNHPNTFINHQLNQRYQYKGNKHELPPWHR